MKAIKITADNAAAIESALTEVNGKARQHTYTDYSEIAALATRAERHLEELSIAKSRRAGLLLSGGCVTMTNNAAGPQDQRPGAGDGGRKDKDGEAD